MFSAYVVVADLPPKPANVVATPVGGQRAADHRVDLGSGHLAHRLDVADVLGDQRDDRGQEHRQHRHSERRGLELGQPHPRRRLYRRRVDVAEDQRQHVTRDDGKEYRQPADDAAEERKRRDKKHQRDESDQRALLEIRLGRRRQVEPDQRDDRPRPDRQARCRFRARPSWWSPVRSPRSSSPDSSAAGCR